MLFMGNDKRSLMGRKELGVDRNAARTHAQLQLYSGVATHSRGYAGWDRAKVGSKPTVVYDLSGLPLFYDYTVHRGRQRTGFVRTSANRALGSPVISTQVTPLGWDMGSARREWAKLLETKYDGYTPGRTRLVCYSYPKLALAAEIRAPKGGSRTLLMDVGDYTEIPPEPGPIYEALGQIPYSVLGELPDELGQKGPSSWNQEDEEVRGLIDRAKGALGQDQMYGVAPASRLETIERTYREFELIKFYSEKVLDFCRHSGECHDHECFCLHPQENSVHCARASAQMMLCYWRYCLSQHELAVAFGVPDSQGTPPSAIVPGLESVTNNCFDATYHSSVAWSTCTAEIAARRPFMICVPGHARACAGTRTWNIWVVNTAQPRYLYIFDPWPPNTGAVSWENFNTTSHMCMFTMARRTTNHV